MRAGAALRLRVAAFGRRAALGGLRIAGLLGLVRGHLGGRGLLILRTASEHNTQGYVLGAGGPRSDGARSGNGAPGTRRPAAPTSPPYQDTAGGVPLVRTLPTPCAGEDGPPIVLEEERIRARTVR
ncbi:hypothetical protein San01_65970 [Streptomyces angustmyceticus]|uniref:Uncharacterized protein n=1 Tax=Streptomyces angustmyceticus TaxID=285578 RepID=A0A5J4LRH4_9ACTN|nr:hypothetical protein San01_65970 [Streptomyces angustmyceticus]